MHPMAPFITEELFQILKHKLATISPSADPYTQETLQALNAPACIVSVFPQVIRESDIDLQIEETFAYLDHVVHAIRNIRAEMQMPPGTPTDLIFQAPVSDANRTLIESNLAIIQALVRTQTVSFTDKEEQIPFSASALIGSIKLIIPLPEALKEKEKVRLVKERDKLIAQQNQLRGQLANEEFLAKAPPQLVEKLKASLAQAESSLQDIVEKLKLMS